MINSYICLDITSCKQFNETHEMKEKRSWSEKPIPSLIISIIGLLFIIFALANLLGLVKEPIKNTSSIFGIVFGLILMYPIFKKKKKKN